MPPSWPTRTCSRAPACRKNTARILAPWPTAPLFPGAVPPLAPFAMILPRFNSAPLAVVTGLVQRHPRRGNLRVEAVRGHGPHLDAGPRLVEHVHLGGRVRVRLAALRLVGAEAPAGPARRQRVPCSRACLMKSSFNCTRDERLTHEVRLVVMGRRCVIKNKTK